MFPRALTRRTERAARKKWSLGFPDSKLEVAFGCDAFGDDLEELIFERSWGHGFSLHLYRIRPRDEDSYEVTWLQYGRYGTPVAHDPDDPPNHWESAAEGGAKVHTAIIPADRALPALVRLRVAMQLKLREIEPPPPPPETRSISLGRVSISSSDFHTAYRFVSAAGLGQQDFWAGYQGSNEQERWVPLAIAEQIFSDFIYADDIDALFIERVPTDADRDFFAERFATARDRGDDYGFWYVQERLLAMARTLGDARLTPDLLHLLTLPAGHSEDRSRATAVDILGRTTGHDVRYAADGSARSLDDASAELRSRCEDALGDDAATPPDPSKGGPG